MQQPLEDLYEILQISPNAEPELIQRVFRLLARRYHPDNQRTGNEAVFRRLHDAYTVLSDPAKRAQYDALYEGQRQQRWRLLASAGQSQNDFEAEQGLRLTVLEVFYTRRRMEPRSPGLFPTDIETLTGTPREHLEFTIWFLVQKNLLLRADSSSLGITALGVEYLEQHYLETARLRRRLEGAHDFVGA